MQIIFGSPHLEAFGLFMGTFNQGRKEWTDLYPVQTRMIDGFRQDPDGSAVMMVDVGGGFGHQAALLKKLFPDLPGRLIVQDLPQMKGPDIPGIEFMAHDFWTPQPVQSIYCHFEDI